MGNAKKIFASRVKSANVKIFPEAALGYLIGPVLALAANGIVNTYLIQYWDKVLSLGEWAPLFQTLLPIISAIIIVIGNLLVGRLMSRKPGFAGKARPLILIGMPFIAIALLVLFMVPFPEGATAENPSILALVMITIGYNLYYAVAYPFYYTAHSSLVGLSTRDGKKRSLLATASNAAQLGASGLAGMIGPFLVDWLDLLAKDGSLEAKQAANNKWFILMIIMIVCLVIGCFVEFLFTRERITEESLQKMGDKDAAKAQKLDSEEDKKISMKDQAKACVKDKYWWFIIVFFFLYQFSGMLKNNDATWFSQAFLNGETKLAGTINTVGAIPTALGMVVIWPLVNKFGKANCIKVGGFIASLCGLLGFVCIPLAGNVGAIYGVSIAAFCLKALGTVPAMYISLALLADVNDHIEAKTGMRTDGFTMAVYGSIMVATPGLANGVIAGLNSAFIGNVQALQIVHTSIFFGGEVVAYLIIGIMFLFMNVEKFSNEDHRIILEAQKAACLARGEEWIDPHTRMELEEKESERIAEEERINELKAKCAKKGSNFEEEEAKYQAALKAKEEAKAQKEAIKKAKAEAKKAQKEADEKEKAEANKNK